MKLAGRIGIRVRVGRPALDSAWPEIEEAFAAALTRVWNEAMREPVRDGRAAGARVGRLALAWRGAEAAAVPAAHRRQVETRLRELVTRLGSSAQPAVAAAEIRSWVAQPVEFLARLGDLLEMVKTSRLGLDPAHADALLLRHADALDQRIGAVAWVADVTRPLRWSKLGRDLIAQHTERFGNAGAYFYIWDAPRRDALVALDPRHLRGQVPRLVAPARQPGLGEDFDVGPGTRIVFVGFALPALDIEELASLAEPIEVILPLASFLRESETYDQDDRGWYHEGELAWRMGQEPATFAGLREAWPAWPLKACVQPVRTQRRASASALREILQQRALEADRYADELGQLVLLGRKLGGWPVEIERVLGRLAADQPPLPADLEDAQVWPAGTLGAFVFPRVDRVVLELVRSMPGRAAVEGNWVPRAEAILRRAHGKDRDADLGKFLDELAPTPPLFEAFLDGLERDGLLASFFDAVRLAQGWDWGTRDPRVGKVTGMAVQTRHRGHPALAALIESRRFQGLPDSILTGRNSVFDLQNQFIELPDGNRVHARGTSTDDARGVLSEASGGFYSEKTKVARLKHEVMDRLREPTRRKIGEIVRRMACEPGETRTEKELMAEALKLAMDELGLGGNPDAFENVTMRMSWRVLALQEPVIDGVPRLRILIEPVFKIGDEPWQSGGRAELMDPGHFQYVLLTNYVVNAMVRVLTVFVMAEAALAAGVFIVVTGIVGLGELLLWISFGEAMYLFTTDRSEWSIEGVIETALMAELQAVGFKGLQVAAAPLKLVAGRITGPWIGKAATKWIAFGLRSTITATEFGTLGVMEMFANELFHMTRCRGLSSPDAYASRFKTGFVMGLCFEFLGPAAGPILKRVPGLGPLIRRGASELELAVQLRQSGLAYGEIAGILLKGRQVLEETLLQKLENPEVAKAIADSAQRATSKFLGTFWQELSGSYRTKAYTALFEQMGKDLGKEAAGGLGRLLSARGEQAADALLADLRRTGTDPGPVLKALGALDEAAARALTSPETLPVFARSPNAQEFFTINNSAVGMQILEGSFKGSLTDLERFLAQVRALPARRAQSVLKALLEEHPLPPSVLLDAARAVELDAAAIARLRGGGEANLAPRVVRGTSAELLPEPSGRYMPARVGSKTIGPRFRTLAEARALYDDVIAQTAGRLEVGIWQTEAGEYVVRLGQRAEVDAPAAWRAVQHYHTNVPDILLWRMPAPADIGGLSMRAVGSGTPVTEMVEHPLPDGRRGRAAYTVHPDGSVLIEFTDAAGRPLPPKKFASVSEYNSYYDAHKVYADPATAKALIEDYEAAMKPSAVGEDASSRTATGRTRRKRIAAERELPANEKKVAPELLDRLRAKKLPAYLYRQLLAEGEPTVRRFLDGNKAERDALAKRLRMRDDAEQSILRDKPLGRPRDEFEEDLPPRDPTFEELSGDPSLQDILEGAGKPQGTFARSEARLLGVLEEVPELLEFRPVLRAEGYGAVAHRSQFSQVDWLRGTFQGNRVPDFLAVDRTARILVGDLTSSLQAVIPKEFGAGVRPHFEKTEELARQLLQSLKGRPGFVGCEIHAMDVVRSSTKQMKPKFIGKVPP